MLTFYGHPLLPIARRVWIALLEKQIPFESVVVDLRGKQFDSDFLALNPFYYVPTIVHGSVCLIESIAIFTGGVRFDLAIYPGKLEHDVASRAGL